jgi:hypothetical protein
MRYQITKLFLDGTLEGLTYTEETSVYFPVGFVVKRGPWSGPSYKVIESVRID